MPQREQLQIVEGIYEAALDARRWEGVLCQIADHCSVINATLITANRRVPFSSVIAPRADPEMLLAYARYWAHNDPTVEIGITRPAGDVMTIHDLDRDRFMRSPYYNEYWSKLGYGAERLCVNLHADGNGIINFGIQAYADRDEITGETRERYNVFVPHLTRAVAIARKLGGLALDEAIDDMEPQTDRAGVIVVDREAQVVFTNDPTVALLEADTAIRATGGKVTLIDHAANAQLEAAIAGCAGNAVDQPNFGSIRCRRGEGMAPLLIDVMRFRPDASPIIPVGPGGPLPVALLLIRDPVLGRRARVSRLKAEYGLTRAEAELALEMLNGDGRAAAARRCGISVNTARTHLTRVFEKVGVTRQAELVRVLTNSHGH